MSNLPPPPLTTAAQRSRATAILTGAQLRPAAASAALIETLDLICAAVVRTAGVDTATARMALAALWEHPVQSAVAAQPRRQLRISDREREFLRDLGERIRFVRGARRKPIARIALATGIPYDQIGDLERGVGLPTLLGLYRLGEALETPLPLLLDETKTQLDLLRALASLQTTRTDPPRG